MFRKQAVKRKLRPLTAMKLFSIFVLLACADTIYVAVVARDGRVLTLQSGNYNAAKAAAFKAQWRAETKN